MIRRTAGDWFFLALQVIARRWTVARSNAGDWLFLAGQVSLLGSYVLLIAALLAALASFTSAGHVRAAIHSEEIRFAMKLSLLSCTLTMLISLWIAVPAGYVLSRARLAGLAFWNVRRLIRVLRNRERAKTAAPEAIASITRNVMSTAEERTRKPNKLRRLAGLLAVSCYRDLVTPSPARRRPSGREPEVLSRLS